MGTAVSYLHALCARGPLQVRGLYGRRNFLVIGAVILAVHKGFCPNFARMLPNRQCAIAGLRLEPLRKKVYKVDGWPRFYLGLLLGHPNGRTYLGGVSGLLLVRSVCVGDCCDGIPAAEVRCHNTHGKKPDYHSHADIFPFSCGLDADSQGEPQVIDVAGSVDRIERLADGHCRHNWLYAGVGVTSQVSSPFRISQVLCFCSRSISADTPLAGKRNCGGKAIDCIEGIACF